MLQALAYLHQRGIIHHDLKPNNVMVVNDQVKLLDFGLALAREHLSNNDATGTLYYMAPELLAGSSASIASDLYAVGVIIYELLTGTVPFDSTSNKYALMYKIVRSLPDDKLIADSILRDVIMHLLQKDPANRYANANDVIEAICNGCGYPRPSESKAVRESFLQSASFVGRQAELETLRDALNHAQAGQGSAWLIGGESGVGKSRLLEELRTQALVDGALVLRGQAVAEGGTPYQIWREALRRVLLETTLTDDEAAILKPILPDIGKLLDREVADPPPLDAQAQQQRLWTLIAKMFEQNQLTVLLLEDLQWADESLQFLTRLIEQTKRESLLIIGTYRDDERPTLPKEFPGASHIKLTRFSFESIAQLSQSMLGDAGKSAGVLDLLEREMEGNVFFIVEVVRALAEEAGGLGNIGHTTLPQSVFAGGIQNVTRRRLDRVPQSARRLLTIAAVMGRTLDIRVLQMVMPELNIDRWLQQVTTVIEVQDNRYRFAHDKLREASVAALDTEDRHAIHWQIACAIETVYPDSPQQYATLAHHWGAADNPEAEARYALLAAHAAHQLYARGEGAAYYIQAVTALAKLPDTVETRRESVDAIISWADVALMLLGPLPLLERLAHAEHLARSLPSPDGDSGGDRRRLAHIQLWIGHVNFNRNHMTEAYSYYREVLTKAEEFADQSLLRQPAAVIGRLYGVQGRYIQAEPLLTKATPLLAEIGIWDQWLVSIVVLALVKAGWGNVTEGIEMIPAIYKRAKGLKDYASMILCNTTACAIQMLLRHDLEAAAQHSEKALRFLIEYKDFTFTYIAYGYAMWLESRRGNHQLALGWMAKAHEVAQQAGSPLLLHDTFAYAEAELSFNRGDYAEAFALANTSLEIATASNSVLNQARTHSLIARTIASLGSQQSFDWNAVEASFMAGLSLSEANDMRLESANIHADWGQLLKMNGKSPMNALDHLEKAAQQFAESGLVQRHHEMQQWIHEMKSER
ncbi:MAG: AAA family ATPase [Chloroflexota bacterium]